MVEGIRNSMPEISAAKRIKNFEEIALGFDESTAIAEAKRCLHCPNPRCVTGCPISTKIPDFICEISNGNFEDAYKITLSNNLLTAICSRVCPQEKQCEGHCVLGIKGQPIAIGALERFVADYAQKHNLDKNLLEKTTKTGKKVAIVGSGPSGLVVAGELVQKGHEVTVFETLPALGGILMYGIPAFRLPKDIVDNEIVKLKKLGVKFVCNIKIGKDYTLQDLLKKLKFNAIFLGFGADKPKWMHIEGENLQGVWAATEFLCKINLNNYLNNFVSSENIKIGKQVAVIGGGNVAMDAARTVLRLGAEKVYIVYRRTEAEMPACKDEIEPTKAEGVEFKILTNPSKIIGNGQGLVTGLECLKMVLGEPDASGRRSPIAKKGSEFILPVDMVIMALGQDVDSIIKETTPELQTNDWGNIIVDDNGATNVSGIFAGGDVVTGPQTVVKAVKAAKIAALTIDNYLKKN